MELIQWPSCQADYWASSEDIEDALTFMETPETKEKIGYTKLDLLNKLKENKGDVVEVLQNGKFS